MFGFLRGGQLLFQLRQQAVLDLAHACEILAALRGFQVQLGLLDLLLDLRRALQRSLLRLPDFIEVGELALQAINVVLQIRQALRENPDVKQTLGDISDEALMERLGSDIKHPEGLFFPDTYIFTPGSSDYDLLRRAYQEGQRILDDTWAKRQADLPLSTPYEALVLASIIEKETGHGPERRRVSGVFTNRLKIGMLLQTDPTVIYGMGDAYQGRIRKRDLQTDTPWNTYTRPGLPPTPIAAAGRAALLAAVQPEQHKFLFFVSRGNGTSEFSVNLSEHNRNVSRYILGQTPAARPAPAGRPAASAPAAAPTPETAPTSTPDDDPAPAQGQEQ